jgi:hypothetical protein
LGASILKNAAALLKIGRRTGVFEPVPRQRAGPSCRGETTIGPFAAPKEKSGARPLSGFWQIFSALGMRQRAQWALMIVIGSPSLEFRFFTKR